MRHKTELRILLSLAILAGLFSTVTPSMVLVQAFAEDKEDHDADKEDHDADKEDHDADKEDHDADKEDHDADKNADKEDHDADKEDHDADKEDHEKDSSGDGSGTENDLENENDCNISGYGNVCVIVSANAQTPVTGAGLSTAQEIPMELALPT
jgi:hypothetical protein